jgi:hypothetical protein
MRGGRLRRDRPMHHASPDPVDQRPAEHVRKWRAFRGASEYR